MDQPGSWPQIRVHWRPFAVESFEDLATRFMVQTLYEPGVLKAPGWVVLIGRQTLPGLGNVSSLESPGDGSMQAQSFSTIKRVPSGRVK